MLADTSIIKRLSGLLALIKRSLKLKIGISIFIALLIIGLIAPIINNYRLGGRDPADLGIGKRWELPSSKFPLGTDDYGRDLFGMLLIGIRYSLFIGIIAGFIGMLIALSLGFISGYKGGLVDHIIRTVIDSFLVIPTWPIFMIVATYIPKLTLITTCLLLAVFGWAGAARAIRAQVLAIKERSFIKLAKMNMLSDLEIIFLELMPTIAPYIIMGFVNMIMGAIFAETGLRLIGIGPPLLPTLGYLLNITLTTGILSTRPYVVATIISVLALIFISLNLINLGLEEEFNPRLKKVTGL